MSKRLPEVEEHVLEFLEGNRSTPATAAALAHHLGLEEKPVRDAIDQLRQDGLNIRNKRGVGFWLGEGPAPTPDGPVTDVWQDEPPIQHGPKD